MSDRYWVGKYGSDVAGLDYFNGSITYYGNGEDGNTAFCGPKVRASSDKMAEFVTFASEKMNDIIRAAHDATFIFYSQICAHETIHKNPALRQHIIGLNESRVLETLNNKAYTKIWLANITKTTPFTLLSKGEIRLDILRGYFPGRDQYVVQQNSTSGGKGTLLLTPGDEKTIVDMLSDNELLLVSPYIEESYPGNVHICVTPAGAAVFPVSLQIIRNIGGHLAYCGCDYLEAKRMPGETYERVCAAAAKIGRQAALMGYVGVMGIDFIISKGDIFFVEINPRFQGSSLPLSRALKRCVGKSLYQIHKEAFDGILPESVGEVVVACGATIYTGMDDQAYCAKLFGRLESVDYCEVLADGYRPDMPRDYFAYQYRALFTRPITYINPDGRLNAAENLFSCPAVNTPVKTNDDVAALKISLLTQGVRLEDAAKENISQTAPIKNATFNAVDITVFGKLTVNCPVNIPFAELSPYRIDYDEINGLQLFRDDSFISDVSVDVEDAIANNLTAEGGVQYSSIGFRTNDRVRIKHSAFCYYKRQGRSCAFCNSKQVHYADLSLADIFEVIDAYERDVNFRHYLIGGASGDENNEPEKIKEIIRHIRAVSEKPIYLMSLPPEDISDLRDYYTLGLNEVAFNLEIFDRGIAKRVMPGKGALPLERYFRAFEESVRLFGERGNVRSMLIVGMEPTKSLFAGIDALCARGVVPMLSVLRPMPGTGFENAFPQGVAELKAIYDEAARICAKRDILLGPACPLCQNNTMSLPEGFGFH